ncbi:MAG: hypothetical protein ACK45H_04630 [Bacteroidota bacterium]|jgi:hypothetical protein
MEKSINRIAGLVFLTITIALGTNSCEKEGKCGEENISQAGQAKSHNFGMNCMNCHKDGGEGEGCFRVAGSVTNSALTAPLTSGTIKLFTGPNGTGTLKHTLSIDPNGNFHTTEEIDPIGLYAAVSTSSGTNYMSTSLVAGACNSCHGISTSKLYGN